MTALRFLEDALKGSAEEVQSTLRGLLMVDSDADPVVTFLRDVTSDVVSDPDRRTATEVLETVAEKLKLDFLADM